MLAIAFALLVVVTCDVSGEEASLRDTIDSATAPYRSKRPFAALSVGILQNGQRQTFAFGHTGEGESKREVDGKTLFEIGSLTKVFTSLCLASMVERGDVKLDDPVRKLLPDWKISEDAGRITLHELSTHTSGLPRLPIAMIFDEIMHRENPYVAFNDQRLEHFLASWQAPDKKDFLYSNLGVGLLGTALMHQSRADSYEALVKSRVTTPLGLKDTTITLTDEQRARYAHGFTVKGATVSSWDFVSLAGAGAVRSNVDDLLVFADQQIDPDRSPLKQAIRLSQQTRKPMKTDHIGLAWLILEREGRTVFFHNGATGGYTTFFGFIPESRCAVVILSNTADAQAGDRSLDKLGFELLKSLSAEQKEASAKSAVRRRSQGLAAGTTKTGTPAGDAETVLLSSMMSGNSAPSGPTTLSNDAEVETLPAGS